MRRVQRRISNPCAGSLDFPRTDTATRILRYEDNRSTKLTHRHLTKQADPSAQAEWFLGIAKDLREGVFPELQREEAALLSKLSSCAEMFAIKRAGEGDDSGILESLAAVSILRSSGAIPGRTASDFTIGEAVRDLKDRRTGTVVGESSKTGELAVKWVGQNDASYVRVESVISLPHIANTKLEGTEVFFDETATAKLNGMSLTPSNTNNFPIVRERYGRIIESHGAYFVCLENDIHPITIALKSSRADTPKLIRETVAPTNNRRDMLEGLQWLENDRRVEKTKETTKEANQEIAEVQQTSQIIFEAIMACPGNPRDAMWMADHLSRNDSLVEATERAVEAQEEVSRTVVIESLSEAENAFVRQHRHVPSITRVVEQMSMMSVPQAPNRLAGIAQIGSHRAALGPQVPVQPNVEGNKFRMGMPNRVYVKRTSEINQGAGKSRANAELISQVEDLARKAQVAASRGKNNPKQASANRAIAQTMIDLFQILFTNQGEPWNPLRTSTSQVEPKQQVDPKSHPNQQVQANQQVESTIYEIYQELIEEILADEELMKESEDDMKSTLVAGRPIRIRAERPSTVYGKIRETEPDGSKLQGLQGLLTSVRRAARMVMSQPGSRQYNKRLAMAILTLLDFATQNSDQPWGVLDVQ